MFNILFFKFNIYMSICAYVNFCGVKGGGGSYVEFVGDICVCVGWVGGCVVFVVIGNNKNNCFFFFSCAKGWYNTVKYINNSE
jgi:hypothetical protein